MSRRLIVNIRGANASGKTTLVRQFIEDAVGLCEMELGVFHGIHVQATIANLEQLQRSVCIIGTYDDSKYAGCDKIKSADAIEAAVRYAAGPTLLTHVLFEGFRVSKSYARFGALRNELCRADPQLTWLWALLHAPRELIYERAQARREDGREIDRKELAAVVSQMDGTRVKLKQAFPQDVVMLDPREAPAALYERLVGVMRKAEQGEKWT